MSSKYYAHFVADAPDLTRAGEYTGVVELTTPLRRHRESRELRSVLARNFDLPSEDIRILHWARLHSRRTNPLAGFAPLREPAFPKAPRRKVSGPFFCAGLASVTPNRHRPLPGTRLESTKE